MPVIDLKQFEATKNRRRRMHLVVLFHLAFRLIEPATRVTDGID